MEANALHGSSRSAVASSHHPRYGPCGRARTRLTMTAMHPATRPSQVPATADGMPTSRIANQAVDGCAKEPEAQADDTTDATGDECADHAHRISAGCSRRARSVEDASPWWRRTSPCSQLNRALRSAGVWWRWAPTGVRPRIRGLAPDLDRASRPSTSADPHDWRDLQPASEEHGQPVPVASRPECGLLQGRRDGPRLPTSDETGVALRDARRLGQTGQVGSRSRRAVIRRWHQAAVTN